MIGFVIVGFINSFLEPSPNEINYIEITVDELTDEIEHYTDEATSI